jgi:hypothetical protein
MPDFESLNYTNPTSGSPVATDNVSGTHFQIMKLDGGADGATASLTGTTQYGLVVDVSRLREAPPNGFVSTLNSTITPLNSGATFLGDWEDVNDFSVLLLTIVANQNSGTNDVHIQWSENGVNVTEQDTFSHVSSTGLSRSYPFYVKGRYYRISYENGSIPQTLFRLTSLFKRHARELSFQHGFGGRLWEPMTVNGQSVLFSTAARTATTSFADNQRNPNLRGLWLILNVISAPYVPGSGGLDVEIYLVDISGNRVKLNADVPMGSQIKTTGSYRWVFYPGANQTNMGPNIRQAISAPIPLLWTTRVRHFDNQSYTYNLEVDTCT